MTDLPTPPAPESADPAGPPANVPVGALGAGGAGAAGACCHSTNVRLSMIGRLPARASGKGLRRPIISLPPLCTPEVAGPEEWGPVGACLWGKSYS